MDIKKTEATDDIYELLAELFEENMVQASQVVSTDNQVIMETDDNGECHFTVFYTK